MKFFLHLLIFALLTSSLHAADQNTSKTLTVAIDRDFAPLTYSSFSGEPKGLYIDFWNLWAQKTGYNIKFIEHDWEESLQAVRHGRAIFHSGADGAREWMQKSKQFHQLRAVYYKRADSDKTKIANIGVIDETYAQIAHKDYPKANVIVYNTYSSLMFAMIDRRIDLLLEDELGIEAFMLQNAVGTPLEKLKSHAFISPVYAITNKENKKYIQIFNDGLEKISFTELQALEQKALGKNLVYTSKIDLTSEERAYLENHPIIKVHNEADWAPFNYNTLGKPLGFSIEYMNLLASKIGIQVEYITGPSWDEFVNMLKNEQIDVMLNIAKTKEKEAYFNFTSSYVKSIAVAFAKVDKAYPYNKLRDFEGKTLAIMQGFYEEQLIKQDFPKIKILPVNSSQEALKAVALGRADGTISNFAVGNYLLADLGLSNVVPIFEIQDPRYSLGLHLATNKNNEILRNILEKAKNTITEQELLEIKNRSFRLEDLEKSSILVNLTQEQQDYLEQKKIITMCNSSDEAPLEFASSEQNTIMQGISIDIIKILEEKLNVKFKSIKAKSKEETQKLFKSLACDIMPASIGLQNKKDTLYTKPYLNLEAAIVTKNNQAYVSDLDTLLGRILVSENTDLTQQLQKRYPNIKTTTAPSALMALKNIQNMDGAYTILPFPVASYMISKFAMQNLKISGYADFEFPVSMAIQKEDVILRDILESALASISASKYREISNSWTNIQVTKRVDYTQFYFVIGFIILIALFQAYVNRRLQNSAKEKADLIERLDLALKISNIGTFEWDMQSNKIIWNNQNHRIYGTDPQDFEPYFDKMQQFFPEYEKSKIEQGVKDAIESKDTVDIKHFIIKKNGELRFVHQNFKVTQYDNNNRPLKIVGTIIDITEQNRYEVSLIKEKDKAQEATREKAEFLANMSHEIRTPMNAILGMVHLLRESKLDTKQDDYANKIQTAAKNLISIINDILDFSKMEAKKLKIEKINFDMEALLSNVKNIAQISAHEKGLRLDFEYDKENTWFLGDSLRISQVLTNLLANAIKFTASGSVTLELSNLNDNRVQFSISDTGIGIKPEQLTKLFIAFKQADSSTSRKYGGTGLGLAISKELVTLMGGKIWLDVDYKEGSRFVFELTLPKAKKQAKKVQRNREKLSTQKRAELLAQLLEASKMQRPAPLKELTEEFRSFELSKDDADLIELCANLLKKYKFKEITTLLERAHV